MLHNNTESRRKRIAERWLLLSGFLLAWVLAASPAFGQGTVNFSPGGEMIQPLNGDLIRSIGPTLLRARMTDRDGTITSVRFYSGTNQLGTATSSSPNEFELLWSPGRKGNFSLWASATDNKGATGRTARVWISVATNPPSFAVLELETSQTNVYFDPFGINNLGTVVGSIGTNAGIWNNWHSEVLGVFGKSAAAAGVRDDGVIVGRVAQDPPYALYQPFVFRPNHGVLQLPGLFEGYANGISQAGIIGRGATIPWGAGVGFRYDGTNYTFLNGEPADMNDAGVIVGWRSTTPYGPREAFMDDGTGMRTLAVGVNVGATAVNCHGHVVGYTDTNAFLYQDGLISYMGTLGARHVPLDINKHGVAVGHYYRDNYNPPSAFLFHDGVIMDLHRLIPTNSGWWLRTARCINDSNLIIGCGSRPGDGLYPNQGSRGFLLKPQSLIRVTRLTAAALDATAYPLSGQAVIERSSDLVHWEPVLTNAVDAAEIPLHFTFDSTNRAAFYRINQP